MILADVIAWFLIITGLLVVFVCYWLATRALFPAFTEQCRERFARPFGILATGAAVGGPLIAFGIKVMATHNPWVRIAGGIVIGLVAFAGLGGSAGLAERIGAGLTPDSGAPQPLRTSLRGGAILSLTFLLPFVGWFILLPLVLLAGTGATLLAAFNRRPTAAKEAMPASGTLAPAAK